jgi:hypothetical protein
MKEYHEQKVAGSMGLFSVHHAMRHIPDMKKPGETYDCSPRPCPIGSPIPASGCDIMLKAYGDDRKTAYPVRRLAV